MTNDNIKTQVFGLIKALLELQSKLSLLQFSPRLQNVNTPDVFERIERWAVELKAFMDQTLSDVYLSVARQTDVIVQLTNDPLVLAPTKKLSKLTTAEITDLRELAEQLETMSDVGDFLTWVLKWGGAANAFQMRRMQIIAATTDLENYYRAAA